MTLPTQENENLLQQFKTGFKKTVNWKKYQSEAKVYTQNWYLNHLIDTGFKRLKRLFA